MSERSRAGYHGPQGAVAEVKWSRPGARRQERKR